MVDSETEYPKVIKSFPDRGFNILELKKLRDASELQRIYIPRYTSTDNIPYNAREVWDLDVGIVPITGITQLIIEKADKIVPIEYNHQGWEVKKPHKKGQKTVFLPHMLKPYISVRRCIASKRREK